MQAKDDNLKKNGCFNGNHNNVTAGVFDELPFFDKKDIVQVKYEMIRAASNNEGSVTEIADSFGFSRKSFYQIREAFRAGGLFSLVPKKTGPKGASKLKPEALEFIEKYISMHEHAKVKEVSAALESEMGIKVHSRTIYRHIKKN